ncbi:MAG: cyclophilin-like fold protein [Bacillota bacterium]|nr:cyclophilin-like fold protein [Bacillota bacterium]
MEKYIQVKNNEKIVIYQLNESEAAKELLTLLPLQKEVENFSNNEKIVYLPKALNTQNTPMAQHGIETLSYFEPWHNIVFYYDDFGPYPGLYQIGKLVKGQEYIKDFQGLVEISEYHE